MARSQLVSSSCYHLAIGDCRRLAFGAPFDVSVPYA
jgi:hypothetical protein